MAFMLCIFGGLCICKPWVMCIASG